MYVDISLPQNGISNVKCYVYAIGKILSPP
jgi:hypothetical protein